MVLRYGTYLDLLTALDEYYKCKKSKGELQGLIYSHFIGKFGSFIAVNKFNVKQRFHTALPCSNKQYDRDKKQFRNFMDNVKH